MITSEELIAALPHATDLDGVKDALAREYAIRHAMAETSEDRQTVVDMIGALESMDQEVVLEMTSGAPTTLADGLEAFLEDLDPQVMYRGDDIATGIHALLTYPWPGEEATIATHGANASVGLRVEYDSQHTAIWVGGQEVYRADRDDNTLPAVEAAAEAVHRAVLSRVIGDRAHHVQLNDVQVQDMRAWLERPSGSLSNGGRLSLDAVQGGGVLVRTQPYKYVSPPQ